MKNKTFKGKAIYNPSGKAGEYSYWACNFYVGCSNGCTYCYCKKGILAKTMGMNEPKLKSCFKDENHALEIFEKELKQNLSELQKHGLFFSFTTDPMLPETINATQNAMYEAALQNVKVKILTKRADWVDDFIRIVPPRVWIPNVAFGFTLTGHDELEPNASTNAERIEAMKKLHDAGFKTWASIEPIVSIGRSLAMIDQTVTHCDLYKIGLMSGSNMQKSIAESFIWSVCAKVENLSNAKIYFKDSLLKTASINREDLPSNCVGRDYNIFREA